MASINEITKESPYTGVSMTPEELVRRKRKNQPVWEMILEIMEDVPKEDRDNLPVDGSEEHDHYIYGTPKSRS